MKDKSNGAHYRITNYLFSTDSKLIYTDHNELGYPALLYDPFSAAMQLNEKSTSKYVCIEVGETSGLFHSPWLVILGCL